jgi:hypothetical protein
LELTFRARKAQLIREHNERVLLAWNTATLTRTSRFPKSIEPLFAKDAAPSRRQLTDDEMWERMVALAKPGPPIKARQQ